MYVDPMMAILCAAAAGLAGVIIFAKRNLLKRHSAPAER